MNEQKTIHQDRPPNFRDETGALFLVRCFSCAPERGRENYVPNVATGQCAWCGWPVLAEQGVELKEKSNV